MQAVEFDSGKANEVDMIWGDFMKTQLGVQTMAHYGFRFGNIDDQAQLCDLVVAGQVVSLNCRREAALR